MGVDVTTGEAVVPADEGVFDNYIVKRSLFHSWCVTLLIWPDWQCRDCKQLAAGGRGHARGHHLHERVMCAELGEAMH